MARIVDQWGQPLDKQALKAPQTSRISALANEYLTASLNGLTPARLLAALQDADNGNLIAQHRIFADMEERDAHLAAEMAKRKLALLGVDWRIAPPRNASAAEKAHAEWLDDVLRDAVDPVEDLILALMDAVGHGFAAVEYEWRNEGGEYLPSFNPRPQEWFQLSTNRRAIHVRDASADGEALAPFGWCFHTHGKAKTGYMGRLGLYRVLAWPFIYKAYAIGDFAEYLETFGLPIITGKYFTGASDEEKASLLRAVTALGHDARAIMPADMALEIAAVSTGASRSAHLDMVDWAERALSKGILGQTMSADAQASGIGSGNAQLHGEVRQDILVADAREIAGTLTRDLLYPLIALNRGGIDGLRRCPRFVFDTSKADDLARYADALPKLVGVGMRIPIAHVHDKLRIPQSIGNEPVLAVAAPANVLSPDTRPEPSKPTPVALAALVAKPGELPAQPQAADVDLLTRAAQPGVDTLLDVVLQLVATAPDLATLQTALVDLYGGLDTADLTRLMAAAMALAELKGMDAVRAEAASA